MKIFDLTNEHIEEAPIQMDPSEPNNPTVYGHEKANPMTLKGRIMSARAQLKELAKMADSNELEVWERITKLAKGGMFMGLEQNFEQIRHGIDELAKKRRKGGTSSRGINKGIGEKDVEEGGRNYDDNRTGFGRGYDHRGLDQELAHETNNYGVSINGKMWKVFGSRQEANRVSNAMERKYPDKKIGVHATGASVSESATAGATSAGSVASVSNTQSKPTKKGKHGAPEAPQLKNVDGTAKNALNVDNNLLGGKPVKR
jgi:hypothetical protein